MNNKECGREVVISRICREELRKSKITFLELELRPPQNVYLHEKI
jgi:hypothetical protein